MWGGAPPGFATPSANLGGAGGFAPHTASPQASGSFTPASQVASLGADPSVSAEAPASEAGSKPKED